MASPESARARPLRATGAQQLLLLELQRETYALWLDAVAGLVEPAPLRTVHGAPRGVLGLAEWRGRLLTVIDLPLIVGDSACSRPPCLVRLAAPWDNLALYVPGPVKLSHAPLLGAHLVATLAAEPDAPAPGFEHVGSWLRLIDPARLLLRLRPARER
jgi:hypothetical protein